MNAQKESFILEPNCKAEITQFFSSSLMNDITSYHTACETDRDLQMPSQELCQGQPPTTHWQLC